MNRLIYICMYVVNKIRGDKRDAVNPGNEIVNI